MGIRPILPCTLLCVLLLPVLTWAQTAGLEGVFSSDPVTVTLQRAGSGWTGRVVAQGQSIALEGLREAGAGALEGFYSVDGQRYNVRISGQGSGILLEAEGYQLPLPRVGVAPPAPADAPPPSPAPAPAAAAPAPSPPAAAPPTAPSGGPDEIVNPQWGLRFTPPEGWVAQFAAEQGIYVLGSHTMIGIMVILPTAATALDALRSEMLQGLHEDDGTSLSPAGALDRFGEDGFAGEYQGMVQGERARAHAVGRIGRQGGATVIIATTTEGYAPEHREAARALAGSMSFFEPDVGPIVQEWTDRLRGMVLSKYDRYSSGGGTGGYTSRVTIDLCVAGHFFQSDSFQASIDVGGAFGSVSNQGGGAGTWEVTSVGGQLVLRLRSHEGQVRDLPLGWGDVLPSSSTSRYTRVGNVDYLRTRSERPGC